MAKEFDISTQADGWCQISADNAFLDNWCDLRIGQYQEIDLGEYGKIEGRILDVTESSLEMNMSQSCSFYQYMYPPHHESLGEIIKRFVYISLAVLLGGYTFYGAFIS